MTSRNIKTEGDREALIRLINQRPLPMSVTIAQGASRSLNQNQTQFMWFKEIADQLGGSAEEWRAYCKLRLAIPIRRREDPEFMETYDRILKGLPYEDKLACMVDPIDLPVTRDFNVACMQEYMDEIQRHFAEQGVILTQPEER